MTPASPSPLDPRLPEGLGERRTAILLAALGELDKGVVEVPRGSNRGPRVDVYLPSWQRAKTPGPSWCSYFVCWVLGQALGEVPTGRVRGSTYDLRSDAKAAGIWRERDYLPSPGDVFMLDHGSRRGHVGFVLGVRAGEVETVEGNSGDRVRAGRRRLDDRRLSGFICTVPGEPFASCWWTGFGEDVSAAGTR